MKVTVSRLNNVLSRKQRRCLLGKTYYLTYIRLCFIGTSPLNSFTSSVAQCAWASYHSLLLPSLWSATCMSEVASWGWGCSVRSPLVRSVLHGTQFELQGVSIVQACPWCSRHRVDPPVEVPSALDTWGPMKCEARLVSPASSSLWPIGHCLLHCSLEQHLISFCESMISDM